MAKPLTAIKNTNQENLTNSNTVKLSVRMTIKFLKEHLDPEFVQLFSHSEETAQHLADSFIKNGYDESQVLHLAYLEDEDKEVVIDGMTRLHALEIAKFYDVPVYKHTFKTRTDALLHAYRLQLDRRNLTDSQKIVAVEKMLSLQGFENNSGKKAAFIGKQLGMSTRNVEKTINIIKNADEDTKEEVFNSKISINAADKKINAKKKNKDTSSLAISDNVKSKQKESHDKSFRKDSYELGYKEGFIAAALFVIGEILNSYEPSYIYEEIFSKEKLEHKFLSSLIPDSYAQMKISELRNRFKSESISDFNPNPLLNSSNEDIFQIEIGE